jgi:hypothetical protein
MLKLKIQVLWDMPPCMLVKKNYRSLKELNASNIRISAVQEQFLNRVEVFFCTTQTVKIEATAPLKCC